MKAGSGSTPPASAANLTDPHHLVWVWQFTTDAAPNLIGERLRDHKLGLVLKTHDGTQWMSEYDKSPFAVSGAPQVGTLANYYEGIGVPFHAWMVLHGLNPKREAEMAAEVLEAGARSIFLDVEPYAGFWRGSPADAEAFGKELRRLQPNGRVVLSIDSRPWTLERLPLKEFTAFSDEIAPQNYWRTFNTPANHTRFAETGFPVGSDGVTPEFLLKVSSSVLAKFGLPIIQVGQGATPDSDEFRRFIDGAYNEGANYVTVWRYGVTGTDVFNLLKEIPPRLPPAPVAVESGVAGVHVVVEGDTLGALAGQYGTSVDAIMQANSLTDATYIYVGQELTIPGAGGAVAAATDGSGGSTGGGSGRVYAVESGDTLYGIAGKFGVSADAIVSLNGLADPSALSIGQELRIP
ncbi:MAG: LysM peptidoglycan-binding domain-containing protein [Dehalococcoidia bacterium]|nr:LysM peptidoglycan-binding domain-containing protein [Dehalococcoidia bacterium]